MKKFDEMIEKEQYELLFQMGIQLYSPYPSARHSVKEIPVYRIYSFNRVGKYGTVLFDYLEVRFGGPGSVWFNTETTTLSDLKKRYREETGESLRISAEVQREINSQKKLMEKELDSLHKVFEGNIDHIVVNGLPYSRIGRFVFKDKRKNPNPGDPGYCKVYSGHSNGRRMVIAKIWPKKDGYKSHPIGFFYGNVVSYDSTPHGSHKDWSFRVENPVLEESIASGDWNGKYSHACMALIGHAVFEDYSSRQHPSGNEYGKGYPVTYRDRVSRLTEIGDWEEVSDEIRYE